MNNGGWLPLPDVTVAVFPDVSVTVNVTASGRPTPSSVLAGPPQVHVKENAGLAPVWVRVMTLPSVHCAVQSKVTRPLVPSGNEVDSRAHTVAMPLVMRHSVVGLGPSPGSNIRKLAEMPPPPLWLMVTVWPAIVSVPDRAAPVPAATVAVTPPLPVPDAPAPIVMKDALLVAVQAHVLPAVTAMVTVPPPLPTEAVAGDTEKAHVVGVRKVSVAE
jgi:hypothetical protein